MQYLSSRKRIWTEEKYSFNNRGLSIERVLYNDAQRRLGIYAGVGLAALLLIKIIQTP